MTPRIRSLAFILALLFVSACEGGARRQFMSIGTAGTGGIYYPIGGAIASRLSVADSSRQYTAEVTGGSVENVNRMVNGQMDLAFALPVTLYEAYNGSETFPEPIKNLRILAPLYANMTHIMVGPGSRVQSISELKGTRVAVGPPGSGTEQIAKQVLEAHGVTYDDIDVRYLSFAEAAAALKDRALDAAIISVGYPASAVLDATTTGDARLIGVDSVSAAALIERHPYYSWDVIPAGAYPGQEEELLTLSQMNWIVSLDTLPDDVVDALLTIVTADRPELARVHPMAGLIDLRRLQDTPIPVHAEVERWLAAHPDAVQAPVTP
ncbi:MAG: TAXI family TRAP transporter solute-binding subunit [Gemmatimonadota bacterium]|nr:TAXI family TRAP transporter solute-binding subunit [Gemmatimonadota bacterium]